MLIFTLHARKSLCSFEGEDGSAGGGADANAKVDTVGIPSSIKGAVEKAAEDLKEMLSDKVEDVTKEEKKDDDSSDDDNDDDDSKDDDDDDGLTELEVKHARDLFKGLKDPVAGKIILEAMVKQSGIKIGASEEKKETVVDTIEAILEKHLGENFPTLAKILGPAIKEAVEKETERATKDVRISNAQQIEERNRQAIDTARDQAFGRYENATSIPMLQEVSKLMDQIKPAKGANPVSYFNSLVLTAADNLGIDLKKSEGKARKDNVETFDARRERNRNDAKVNLATKDSASIGKEVRSGKDAKPASIRDAVEEAARQLAGKTK